MSSGLLRAWPAPWCLTNAEFFAQTYGGKQ
jgi:hypothetical protein